ncbi:MAG: TonB-dependent receptor [Mucinivorans sp.]
MFLTIPPLFAQRPSPQPLRRDSSQIITIDKVTVSGSRAQKEVIPSQVLSGEQLQRLSVHSVADALRYFSGVQIKDYGGIGGLKTVNIRSLGSHHVGVFYDGVELGNAQNGVVDLGRFSLDNMESISMYNGQKSAIFQSAKDFASASSIYMSSRAPVFKDQKRDNFNIALSAGSFATINPSLQWEHNWGRGLSSSLSAEYMHTSGEYKFRYAKQNGYDTTEVRKNGDVGALRVEGTLLGRVVDGQWKAKVYYYTSERGYPGAAVRQEPGKFRHQDRQWDDNVFVQGSWRQKLSDVYSLLLNVKYAYDYLRYLSDPNLDITTMYLDNRYKQQESYVSAANMFSIFDWWSASLAVDFQHNTLDADLVDFVYPTRYSLLTAVATSITFEKFKFQASLLHTYVNDQTRRVGGSAGRKSEYTPTIVASYQPFATEELSLRAFYKRVFRMPTLGDLYYTFIGNTNLSPEYTNQYDVGITYCRNFAKVWLKRVELQVDAYYNQVQNKIIAMPTSNQFRWTMLNLGYVEILGVDVGLQGAWRIGRVEISTRLNYTYQKAQDFTEPGSTYYGGQIPYVPWHSGGAIVGGSYRGWKLNYSFIYTGERYQAVANIPENYAQPWYTHDLSLSRTIQLKKLALRLTGQVNNIFNQPYEVVQCYPMPGTNFKIKINVIL